MQSTSGSRGEGAPRPAATATGVAARAADARASFGGDGVQRALDILSIPSVREAPLSQRIAVLESQGFSEKEISVAMQLADNIAQQQKAVASGDGPGPGPAVLMHPAGGGGGGGSTPTVVTPKEEGVLRHGEEAAMAAVFGGVGSSRVEEAAVAAEGRWQALQPPASFNEGRSALPWLAPVPGMQPAHAQPPPPQEQRQNPPSSSAASIYAGTAPWPLPHVQQHQQPQRVVVPANSSSSSSSGGGGGGGGGGLVEDRQSDAAVMQLLAQQWQEQQYQQQHQLQHQRHYASPQRLHQRQPSPAPPPQQQAQGGGYPYRGPRPPPFPQQQHLHQQHQQQHGTGYVPQHAQHSLHQGGRDFSPLHQQHLVQQRAGLPLQQPQQQHLHYACVQQGMRHRSPLPAHRYPQQPATSSRLPQGEGGEQMLAARLMYEQQQAAEAAGGRMGVGVGAEDGLLDAAELAMLAAEGHGAFPLGLGFPRHARRREAKRLRKAAIVAAGGGPGGLMPPLGMMGNPYAMVDGAAPPPFDPTALVLTSLQQQQLHQQQQAELQEQQAMQQRHQAAAAAAAAAMPLNPGLAGAAMLPPDDALPWYKTIASGRVQKHLMRFMNNFISQKDLEDELGLDMGDVFYQTETGPTMAALYDKLERRVAERCPSHLRAFRAEALASLAQLMAACEEREEQQERGREALKISGQRGKPVRNAAKRLGKSRTEARKLGAMIAYYRALTLREDAQEGQEEGGKEQAARALEGDTKADGKEGKEKERPPGLPSPSAAAAGAASCAAAAAIAAVSKAGEGKGEGEAGALLAASLAGLGLGSTTAPPQSCEPSPDETTKALLSSSSSCSSSSSSLSVSGAA